MLELGNVGQNALVILVLFGVGYIIYSKWKGGGSRFRNLFSRAGEITKKINLKR